MTKKSIFSGWGAGLKLAAFAAAALLSSSHLQAAITGFGSDVASPSANGSASNGTFTVNAGGCCQPNYASITDGVLGLASYSYTYGSGFANAVQGVGTFTSSFTFQEQPLDSGTQAGFAFVLQNDPRGVNTVDVDNGGYPSPLTPMENSFQIVFLPDSDSVGFLTNGTTGAVPTYDVSSPAATGLNFLDPVAATAVYDGTTLSLTLVGTPAAITDSATYTTTDTVNIANAVGKSTAYVGFSTDQDDAGTAPDPAVTFSNFAYAGVPEPGVLGLGLLGLAVLVSFRAIRNRHQV